MSLRALEWLQTREPTGNSIYPLRRLSPQASHAPCIPQVRKYKRAQELLEVQSLTAAINKARANAVSRGMQLAGATGNPIYDTFQFMDVDNRCVMLLDMHHVMFLSLFARVLFHMLPDVRA